MPQTKIPDLTWKDWEPATVDENDKTAIAKGQVENLECNCIDCTPEIEGINTVIEITEVTAPTVQEKPTENFTSTSTWNPVTNFYRNFLPYSFDED